MWNVNLIGLFYSHNEKIYLLEMQSQKIYSFYVCIISSN